MVITPLVEDHGMTSPKPSSDRWPTVFRHPEASAWLQIQTGLGLAPRTLDAYARGLEIPLTDDERAALEDGQAAVDRLLERLADIPTPAGPTPRFAWSALSCLRGVAAVEGVRRMTGLRARDHLSPI